MKSALSAGAWGEAVATIDGIDEDAILMLFLVHERSKHRLSSTCTGTGTGTSSDESRWSPFFAQLDLLMRTGAAAAYPPCSWGSAEPDVEAMLAHTEAGQVAAQATLALEDLHSALFPALSAALPQFFSAETYSLEALSWAAAVFAAYSVQLQASSEEATAIVPMVEAAPRHQTEATCFHEYHSAEWFSGALISPIGILCCFVTADQRFLFRRSRYDADADAYVLRTLRSLRCGEEVSVCRGRGGDAAALLGDSGATVARPCSWVCDGQAVLLQVPAPPNYCSLFFVLPPLWQPSDTETHSPAQVAGTQTKGQAIKAYVTETEGRLLLWPPGANPDLAALRKAAAAYADRIQAAQTEAVSEAAVVQAGRTLRGEVLLRCREYLLTQLAVARAVCDSIDQKTPA